MKSKQTIGALCIIICAFFSTNLLAQWKVYSADVSPAETALSLCAVWVQFSHIDKLITVLTLIVSKRFRRQVSQRLFQTPL